MITTNFAYFFKGKRKDNGEWVAGNYQCKKRPTKLDPKPSDYETITFICDDELGSLPFEVMQETVGMWNGLTDDYGAYFFVGDIIECCNHAAHDLKWGLEKIVVGVLVIIDGKFSLMVPRDGKEPIYLDHWLYAERKAVIGNIHDNPELLKFKNDEHGNRSLVKCHAAEILSELSTHYYLKPIQLSYEEKMKAIAEIKEKLKNLGK